MALLVEGLLCIITYRLLNGKRASRFIIFNKYSKKRGVTSPLETMAIEGIKK